MRTPSSLTAAEPLRRRLRVSHDRGLGDLEDQGAGIDAAFQQRIADVGDELGGFELADREVHREVDPVAVRAPARGLAARFVQHPAADRDDVAGFLEDRHEDVGVDDAAEGMVPSDQCLGAGDPPATQFEDRLVHEGELTAFQCAAEVHVELHALGDRVAASPTRTRRSDSCRRPWRGTTRCRHRAGARRRSPDRRLRCRCWR